MQFTITLITTMALLTAPLTMARVQGQGTITIDPLSLNGKNGVEPYVKVVDNGRTVCNTGDYYVDHDGNYSMNCGNYFIFAITPRGDTAFYGYSSSSLSWNQGPFRTVECCDGACDDNRPKFNCQVYRWNNHEFC